MTGHDLQSILAAGYRRQKSCYDAALASLAAVEWNDVDRHDIAMKHLAEAMAEAGLVEQSVQPIRRDWDQTTTPAGPELKAAVGDLESAIRALLAKIDELTRIAEVQRNSVKLDVDEAIRNQRMQAAYGARGY